MQYIKNIFSDDLNIFMVIMFFWFVIDFVIPSSFIDQAIDGLILLIIMVYFKIRGLL